MYRYSPSKEKNGFQKFMPFLLGLAIVLGMGIGMSIIPNKQMRGSQIVKIDESKDLSYNQIEEVLRYIDAKYVDRLDRDELEAAAIKNLLAELDPHSSFIPADRLQSVNDDLQGNFVGVGIEYNFLEDTMFIINAVKDGPAYKAGIRSGTKIIAIQDSTLVGNRENTQKVINQLKGKANTEVKVTILSQEEDMPKDVIITRDEIKIKAVEIAYMVNEVTGYLKIDRFSATTYDDFMDAMNLLKEKGMQDLIIDLRGNPGGYLNEAVRILNQLIEERNRLLVYTEGAKVRTKKYKTQSFKKYEVDDIVLLVDSGSASASEILAGAFQDLDRGLIIGQDSYGKGLVQEQYELSDGSALRLTVARYYTPTGRSIQKPYKEAKIKSTDTLDRDTLVFYTDNGRPLLGGGGISPDLKTDIPSWQENQTYLKIKPYLSEFGYRYIDDNWKEITALSEGDFISQYEVPFNTAKDLNKFLEKKGVNVEKKDIDSIFPNIAAILKANIARVCFSNTSSVRILNQEDPTFQKAVSVIDDSEKFLEKKDK